MGAVRDSRKAICKRRSAIRDAILAELPIWLEACASCAIEGNSLGKEITDHWNAGRYQQAIDAMVDMRMREDL